MPVVVYVSPERRPRRLGRGVHHRGRRRRGDGPADEHRLGKRGDLDRRGHRRHARARRSRTTPPRSSARSPRATGATAPCRRRMVTEAANVTAAEALDADADRPRRGRARTSCSPSSTASGSQGPKATTLETAGLEIDERDMPFQYELLQLLVNPTVAYLLLLVGLVGIAIELFSPGPDHPRRASAPSRFLLGAFGTAQLPVTAVGIALLVLGLVLIIAEAHLPTHGSLGVVGVVALAVVGPAAVRHRLRGVRGLGPGGDRRRRRCSAAVLAFAVTQGGRRPGASPVADRLGGADRGAGEMSRQPLGPVGPGVRRGRAVARDARRRRSPRPRPNGSASAALECGSRRSRG